jgi:hypothetical protein
LRLPAGYYRLRPFESDGGVYECLGIRWFKKLVRRGPLTVFAPTLRLKLKINDLSSAELVILQQEMCKTEAGHFLIGF